MAVSYGTITLSSIQDGSKWYSGTAITGTSTTATVFSGTGITSAVVGDMYLNTTTFNTYRCTVPGAANVAKWVYVNNIKGGTGSTGKGVSAIVAEYYLSTSDSQQSGGSWSTTPQAYVTGRYYWRRDKVTWTDSTTTYTSAVLDNALTSSNSTAAAANSTANGANSTANTAKQTADAAKSTAESTAQALEEYINPIASKTYTGLIGSSNDWSGATWWFAKVHPSDYNEIWSIRCKIYAEVSNYPAFQQTVDITIRGFQSTFLSYDSNVARGGSLAMYHVNLYRATSAGITANKGHALGFGLRLSTSPTDSTYARTIKVDIVECDGCTVTMIDPAVKYANMDGTGSTNYSGLTEMYVAGNGQNATNNTNTHYTQYANAVKAGAFGVKRYTLLMKQTADTWSSFVNQANTTATTKTVSTAGYILDKLVYSAGGAEYTSGNATSSIYDAYPIDLRYSTNCGTTLTTNKSIYLVGTVKSDGLFYFDTTQWYTQTQPTAVDNKVYIYIGETYSTYQAWLATENPAYIFYNGKFMLYSDYVTQKELDIFQVESQSALDWYAANGNTVVNATTMLAKWADGAFSATTEINGGMIKTHTIQAEHLASDAIMSNNYQASSNPSSPYSATGTFLDLTNGNLYMPNFGVDNVYGKAYLNGEIVATGGRLGVEGSQNYWEIDTTKTDYNANNFASIVGHGNSFIQVGEFQLSNNLLDTRSYDAQAKITYPKYDNTYWDFGVQAPTLNTATSGYVQGVDDNFLYIRNHASTIPSLKTDWNYLFRVDKSGNIYTTGQVYVNGTSLDDRYALKTDVGSTYLPTAGGTITGNLTVNGSINGTATKATQLTHTLSINGKTWSGSANLDVSTIGVGYGGTGATSFTSGAALIGNGSGVIQTRAIRNNTSQGALGWTSSSTDNTLITTNTLAYWNGAYQNTTSNIEYVKQGKLGDVVTHDIDEFITVNGGIIDGSLQVTDLTAGNLVVTGVGRFTNGIYGDLTGNASTADKVNHDLVIQLNGGTTEGTNKFTFNGSAAKTVNVTPSSIGLGNVNNTADSAKNVLTATKFSSARTIALTGDVTGLTSADGSNGWSIATTVKDDSHEHTWSTINKPLLSKTYTGVIATANNQADGNFYFIKVIPEAYGKKWSISYRVYAEIAGVSDANGNGKEYSEVYISGIRDNYLTYRTWNDVANESYRPYYYHAMYRARESVISQGVGLGLGLRSSYNQTTAANSRTITFEIMDYEGCTVSFLDSGVKYTAWPSYSSSNYLGISEFDGATNGNTMSGDRNDVNWQNRENYASRTTYTALYRYQILLMRRDGTMLPINTVDNSVATNKVLTTESFDPFGDIFYWNSTASYSAGGNIGNGSLFRQILVDLRFSFNCGGYNAANAGNLVARKPLYLVATPQSDGTAVLYGNPLSQTLPTSDDGLIYIYLGMVYEDTYPYRCNLTIDHPIYWYKNGSVRPFVQHADSATKLATARSFTVGKTAKNVDWSGAVSFSKAEISDNASGSAAGWMSSAHYTKLEGIEAGAQVNTITGIKGNSESSYRTGNVNITAANIGLGNLTNDKQVKGLASGTTAGHFVTWGANGYTVADSGYTAGQVVKTLASNNDGKIVLTYLDGTTSDPIEVKIIGSSGSSVSYADALNVNGTAVGSATQPVFINAQGKPQTANSIPKLNNGTTGGTFYAPTAAGTSGQFLVSSGNGAPTWTTITRVTGVKGNAEGSYRTGNVNLTPANIGALALSGGTLTDALTLAANKYYDQNSVYALNLNNSDIIGLNGIYFGDSSEDGREGINFYRDATHWDSLHAVNGILYFTPNRAKGSAGERQEVYTTPNYQRGTTDISIRPLVHSTRANRLAFLPADQVIIEKTTDGGATWVDAGYSDAVKIGLFNNLQSTIQIPLLNSAKSTQCGLRVTLTGMKYDVPEGTAETAKYNYWNADHIVRQERYFNVREWWFWLSSNNDSIRVQIEAATGAASTTWRNMFDADFGMNGWSGSDWIRAGNGNTFGGGTTQTGNYWNWRLTFWSKYADGKTEFNSATIQNIYTIYCYGDNVWGKPNNLMANDHLYSWDNIQNATFPANVTATKFIGPLQGNADTATKATQDASGNTITSTYAKLSGATFTGAVNFANNTWNLVGDDAYMGDMNQGGKIGIKGKNGATGIVFVPYSGSTNNTISVDGAGNLTISGTTIGTFSGNLSGNATTATSATKATQDGSGNVITSTYLKKAGDTMTGNLLGNGTATLGTTAAPFHQLVLGGSTNATMTAASTNPRITFCDGTGAQPVHLIYTDYDSYRSPAGLKIIGDSGASPAWLEVEGTIYAPTFSGNATSATKATQDGDGNTISSTYAKLSGAAFTGAVTGTSFGASSYLAANSSSSSTIGGLTLYGTGQPTSYGIAMRTTGNGGKHGYVQGDWAIYSYMSGSDAANKLTRGWIFKNATDNVGVASISGAGNAVFTGSMTVGGNVGNTSGCRLEYDEALDSLNFCFAS